ncbi:hypothetical protein [Flavobacterium urocaniciphilum]|uniref:Lipoprotein n=1 Tax=Flavobacterium urocaniciphilum TaxID=1299341 RepID=A0A1H8YYX0_9FLAO|nr:hypothetical protein [Flavobacterium urocaniciphilum]SEP56568.1 hypothetical protein SAMN05444005_101313 [Flavobacterium urocaniciphilum]
MKRIFTSLFLLILTICLDSCYGLSANEIFTNLNDSKEINCQTLPENVELVFESETIPFNYEKIGLIEVQGNQYSNEKEIILKLKNLAKSKCCDAIIGVKKNYLTRESGVMFEKDPPTVYSTISFNGIAVRKIK